MSIKFRRAFQRILLCGKSSFPILNLTFISYEEELSCNLDPMMMERMGITILEYLDA